MGPRPYGPVGKSASSQIESLEIKTYSTKRRQSIYHKSCIIMLAIDVNNSDVGGGAVSGSKHARLLLYEILI